MRSERPEPEVARRLAVVLARHDMTVLPRFRETRQRVEGEVVRVGTLEPVDIREQQPTEDARLLLRGLDGECHDRTPKPRPASRARWAMARVIRSPPSRRTRRPNRPIARRRVRAAPCPVRASQTTRGRGGWSP